MTIDKFNQAASEYQRSVFIALGLGTFASILTVGACSWLVRVLTLRTFYTEHFGEPASEILLGLTPFPAIPVLLAFIWYGERRASADPRIRCPHCEKVVSQMRAIVVATRNCPYCGRTVLKEPPCKA